MKPLLLLTTFLILICANSFGQTAKTLEGIILNKKTGEKLPFASIYCKNDGIGTISNEAGKFRFNIPAEAKDDSIFISFLGFEKKYFLKRQIHSDSIYIIKLNPISTQLKEVTVLAKGARSLERKIIREAIRRIPYNYSTSPFVLNGYYRDYVRDGYHYRNLIEAALTIFDKGYETNDYQLTQFKINQIRTSPVFKFDSLENSQMYGSNKVVPHSELYDFDGNEFCILRIHDPIRNFNQFSFSFIDKLKSNFLSNHKFQLDSTINSESESFYAISIYKKTSLKDRGGEKLEFEITGRLLINKKTYGIHRFGYSVNCKSKSFTGLLYELNLEYKDYESKLYLNYILFKNYFEFTRPASIDDFIITKISLDKNNCEVNVFLSQLINNDRWREAKIILKVDDKIIPTEKIYHFPNKILIKYSSDNSFMKEINEGNSYRLSVEIKDLLSVNNEPLFRSKPIGLYQYREFFANEIKTKNFALISNAEYADKKIPLNKVDAKIDSTFWKLYNYFLLQPLKN